MKVKNDMFSPDNGHTQKRRYSVNNQPWTFIWVFLMATWIWLIAPYRYTLKRTAKLWGLLGSCSVSSDNFFVFTYTCLSWLLLKPGPGPWNRTLKNLDPKKPGPWKTWTLKNLDPDKCGPWKTWTLKSLDPEKHFYAKTCSCNNWTVKSKS